MDNKERLISDNAQRILEEKNYFRNGEKEWEDIADRVAKAIANGEKDPIDKERVEKAINKSMKNLEFIFSSPCLLNANIERPGQLSSCFILDVKDNIESICETDARCAKIFQRNGGAGMDLSVLRPDKSKVEDTNGYSCGIIGFIDKFNKTADVMTRNNPTKRGALKINLSIWHPDIIEFIKAKDDTSELQLMNISVSIYDNFMEAVKKDEDWNLEFPDYSGNKEIYNNEWDGNLELWKSKGYPVKIYKTIKARELMNIICQQAWKTGEPGVNFQSTMNRANKNPHLSSYVSTNPCNEFVNIPYSSCNLGSINLVKFADDFGHFRWSLFENMVCDAVKWLDDMITVNKLPLDIIQQVTEDIRPIGLGVMGLADMLYKMKIPYNSQEAYEFVDRLFEVMQIAAEHASVSLARDRGAYPKWAGSVYDINDEGKIRNCNLLSIAPTGTISSVAGVSGSIEPNFALTYVRMTNAGTKYYYVNDIFKKDLEYRGIYSDELLEKINQNHGSCQGIDEVPLDMQKIYVTTHDISPKDHVDMLSVIQKHVDLAISKTINFTNNMKVNDIQNVIFDTWQRGIKGITVYRDGCRQNQTLSTAASYKKEEPKKEIGKEVKDELKDDVEEVKVIKTRSNFGKRLDGATYSVESACGKFYVTINRDGNDKIIETFINFKNGLCQSNINALSRIISLSLKNGIPVRAIIEQLKGVSCPSCTKLKDQKKLDGISCPDIIARILDKEDNLYKMSLPIFKNEIINLDKSNLPVLTAKDVDWSKEFIDKITKSYNRETIEKMVNLYNEHLLTNIDGAKCLMNMASESCEKLKTEITPKGFQITKCEIPVIDAKNIPQIDEECLGKLKEEGYNNFGVPPKFINYANKKISENAKHDAKTLKALDECSVKQDSDKYKEDDSEFLNKLKDEVCRKFNISDKLSNFFKDQLIKNKLFNEKSLKQLLDETNINTMTVIIERLLDEPYDEFINKLRNIACEIFGIPPKFINYINKKISEDTAYDVKSLEGYNTKKDSDKYKEEDVQEEVNKRYSSPYEEAEYYVDGILHALGIPSELLLHPEEYSNKQDSNTYKKENVLEENNKKDPSSYEEASNYANELLCGLGISPLPEVKLSKTKKDELIISLLNNKCPECGTELHHGSCVECPNCGWTKCN